MWPALLLSATLAQAEFEPFGSPRAPLTAEVEPAPSVRSLRPPTDNPLYLAFDVYRLTMSSFDGPRCAHHPVCSVYALRAVQRHGLLGVFLALDRLWRDGESSALRPLGLVWAGDRPYFDDPLDQSDFWLRHP